MGAKTSVTKGNSKDNEQLNLYNGLEDTFGSYKVSYPHLLSFKRNILRNKQRHRNSKKECSKSYVGQLLEKRELLNRTENVSAMEQQSLFLSEPVESTPTDLESRYCNTEETEFLEACRVEESNNEDLADNLPRIRLNRKNKLMLVRRRRFHPEQKTVQQCHQPNDSSLADDNNEADELSNTSGTEDEEYCIEGETSNDETEAINRGNVEDIEDHDSRLALDNRFREEDCCESIAGDNVSEVSVSFSCINRNVSPQDLEQEEWDSSTSSKREIQQGASINWPKQSDEYPSEDKVDLNRSAESLESSETVYENDTEEQNEGYADDTDKNECSSNSSDSNGTCYTGTGNDRFDNREKSSSKSEKNIHLTDGRLPKCGLNSSKNPKNGWNRAEQSHESTEGKHFIMTNYVTRSNKQPLIKNLGACRSRTPERFLENKLKSMNSNNHLEEKRNKIRQSTKCQRLSQEKGKNNYEIRSKGGTNNNTISRNTSCSQEKTKKLNNDKLIQCSSSDEDIKLSDAWISNGDPSLVEKYSSEEVVANLLQDTTDRSVFKKQLTAHLMKPCDKCNHPKLDHCPMTVSRNLERRKTVFDKRQEKRILKSSSSVVPPVPPVRELFEAIQESSQDLEMSSKKHCTCNKGHLRVDGGHQGQERLSEESPFQFPTWLSKNGTDLHKNKKKNYHGKGVRNCSHLDIMSSGSCQKKKSVDSPNGSGDLKQNMNMSSTKRGSVKSSDSSGVTLVSFNGAKRRLEVAWSPRVLKKNIDDYREMEDLGLGKYDNGVWKPSDKMATSIKNKTEENHFNKEHRTRRKPFNQ